MSKKKIECSMYACRSAVFVGIQNDATVRLGENWLACQEHMAYIMSFLVERSAAWGAPDDHITLLEMLPS